MIVNRHELLLKAPIKNMLTEKVRGDITSHGLSEAGYDIRLKQDITFHGEIDFVRLTDGDDTQSYKSNFVIASAIEEFQMPSDLVAVVHDKSTWARQGLSVFNTVIEPGWHGFLTLELVYHGSQRLHLPAGCGIAQILFQQVQVPVSYYGKYQGQENRPVPAKKG